MRFSVTVKFRKDYVKVSGDTIEVGVRARPEKGKANEELMEKIAAHFGVAKSRVIILSGVTSRRKVVEIE